ncbi:MAG: SsrA-binding protein SmpB [Candidatus Sumerlaeia bacterium]|nr:SsrA-binding protein SmpB [Candidatus Sumerlaeia bacterium]
MAKKADKKNRFSNTIRIENRKARFEYEILERVEAGIELTGCEVKSIRLGQASLNEVYAANIRGQIFLKNMHIKPYEEGNYTNPTDPYRARRLLLHRKEIDKLGGAASQQGLTLVPLKLYFTKKGWAKVELGLCRGKKAHDKRATIKERDLNRDLRRELKNT